MTVTHKRDQTTGGDVYLSAIAMWHTSKSTVTRDYLSWLHDASAEQSAVDHSNLSTMNEYRPSTSIVETFHMRLDVVLRIGKSNHTRLNGTTNSHGNAAFICKCMNVCLALL